MWCFIKIFFFYLILILFCFFPFANIKTLCGLLSLQQSARDLLKNDYLYSELKIENWAEGLVWASNSTHPDQLATHISTSLVMYFLPKKWSSGIKNKDEMCSLQHNVTLYRNEKTWNNFWATDTDSILW